MSGISVGGHVGPTGPQGVISLDDANSWSLAQTFVGGLETTAIKITGGSPGANKVLVSDADGDASWQSSLTLATLLTPGYIEYTEMADPAAPAANKVRVFSRDNGSGKTQLCARFPTGAVQVIATEP